MILQIFSFFIIITLILLGIFWLIILIMTIIHELTKTVEKWQKR